MAIAKPPIPKRSSYKILTSTTSQKYPIVTGVKATGNALMSAQVAEKAIAVAMGEPVAMASSTITLEEEGTTKYAEWTVYVLMKS